MNEGEESSVKGAVASCRSLPSCARKYPGRQCHFTASTRDMANTLPDSSLHSHQARDQPQGQGQCRRGPWSHAGRGLLCESLCHTSFCGYFFALAEATPGGDRSFFPIFEVRCLLHMGRRAYGPLCLFLSQDSLRLGKLHTAC